MEVGRIAELGPQLLGSARLEELLPLVCEMAWQSRLPKTSPLSAAGSVLWRRGRRVQLLPDACRPVDPMAPVGLAVRVVSEANDSLKQIVASGKS